MMSAYQRTAVLCFQGLLTGLGILMVQASRVLPRFRRQITRDLLFEISSQDGARQRYRLHARTRTLTMPRDRSGAVDCALSFPTASTGLRTLISRRTIGRIVEGMNTGGIRIEGNPVLMLWFHGLTRIVAPIGSTRRPRRPAPVPVREPERDAPYARRIVREPAVQELSREWPEAWAARETLLQIRAAAGHQLPPG